MLLYGPRWLLSLPLFLLIPMAAFCDRLLLIPLAIAALIIFAPFMRFNLPLGKITGATHPGMQKLRVFTCNIDSARFDTTDLVSTIKEMSVDIVALQECPEDIKLLIPVGWYMIKEGSFAIISRFPVRKVNTVQITSLKSIWPGTYLLHTIVHSPDGDIAVCTIQLPTPRVGLMRILDRHTVVRPSRSGKFYEETDRRRYVALEVRRYIDTISLPLIIAGDFNTTVESTIYRLVWNRFKNAFSEAGLGYGWSQRVAVRGYYYSSRIDHILTGKGLTPLLSEVGPDIGSDHLPLIADIGIEGIGKR